MERLKPALGIARTNHLPRWHVLGKAFRLDAAEVLVLEQIGQKPLRRRVDYDGVGNGGGLQARREVRGLADDPPFLRLPGTNKIADHDQAGADAMRTWSGSAVPSRRMASMSTSPDRTARSASSSWAFG